MHGESVRGPGWRCRYSVRSLLSVASGLGLLSTRVLLKLQHFVQQCINFITLTILRLQEFSIALDILYKYLNMNCALSSLLNLENIKKWLNLTSVSTERNIETVICCPLLVIRSSSCFTENEHTFLHGQ